MNGKFINMANNKLNKSASFGQLKNLDIDVNVSRVRIIYTGGTIGMIRNENGVLAPAPNTMEKELRRYPNLNDEKFYVNLFGKDSQAPYLCLPAIQNEKRRILYTIQEYNPVLDSSNMGIDDWIKIASDIKESYQFFDGFVILHGTDTLSYTASALSFMLENLGKTVIITGSQIPIFETRTDGKDNFTSSLIIAGNYPIPEVCVFFGNKLLRGNRTIKQSSESLEAFYSPNFPPLGKVGVTLDIDYKQIFRPYNLSEFTVHTDLDQNVGILRLFPNISTIAFKAFLHPPMKGIVLQSFGAGNVPSNRQDFLDSLKDAEKHGIIVVNCTQCTEGTVSKEYETGSILYEYGVVPGYDMTPETALSKLAYVLTKDEWDFKTKKQMLQTNIRGELTSGKDNKLQEHDLIDAVARSLPSASPQQIEQLSSTLFPAMVNTAIKKNNIEKINNLKASGADLSLTDYDQRTSLHIACAEGNLEVARLLLMNGVSVHARDRSNKTALLEAITGDFHELIRLLLNCGAHLTGSGKGIGEELCIAAAKGSIERLKSYNLAKADLSQEDISGRTALHMAALHNHLDVVEYLLEQNVDREHLDKMGFTPLDYAKKGGNNQIINLLQ